MERLQAKREQITQDKEAVTKLTKTIYDIVDLCGLDEEKMIKRVAVAKKSEYGRINGLINLLAAVTYWPAEAGDGTSVSNNQKMIQDSLKLDTDLLEDIRNFRGYHSFVTEDLEILDGVEPLYEDYSDYCVIFLEELGLKSNRPTINSDTWNRAEAKAKVKAQEERELMKAAIAEHKRLMGEEE